MSDAGREPRRWRMVAIFILLVVSLANSSDADDLAWALQPPSPDTLPRGFGQSMPYDPTHDRVLLFGGTDGLVPYADLWALSLSQRAWRVLHPGGAAPEPRMGQTMVFDPSPPRMVLFGGWGWTSKGAVSYNDCWALSLGEDLAWARLQTFGKAPSPRNHHSAIYDARRNRMLVFGGGKREVWSLSLGDKPTWTRLETVGTQPPPFEGHSAVYDARRNRILVFGGTAGNYSPLMRVTGAPPTKTYNDVWALSLTDPPSWAKLTPLGEPPSVRYYHAAVLDTAGDHMLVFSGGHSRGSPVSDAWSLSLGGQPQWSKLEPAGAAPSPRRMHATSLDPVRGTIWLHGGAEEGNYESWYA